MWNNTNINISSEICSSLALILSIIGEQSIFFYNPDLQCEWRCLNYTGQPQWVWNTKDINVQLNNEYNKNIFVLACLPSVNESSELSELLNSINHLTNAKVLIEVLGSENQTLAKDILLAFRQKNIYQVALHFENWTHSLNLYRFDAYPEFTMIKWMLKTGITSDELYPNQLMNLKGFTMRVMPDLSEPNTLIIKDNGNHNIGGFLWHFVETFAKKLNASLTLLYPTWQLGRSLGASYMLEFTRNKSIDIGLVTVQLPKTFNNGYYQHSYPVLFSSWCVMMPLERPIEICTMFLHVFRRCPLILTAIVFFTCCLLSFLEIYRLRRNYVLSIIRLPVTFLICACQAQLLFLFVNSPSYMPIDSFDALIASDLRILVMNSEFYFLPGEFRARYASAFRLTDDINMFFTLRNTFNTSWAYSITSNKWSVMQEQQRNFKRTIFRYSELCLHDCIPYSIVLEEDSVYNEPLKLFTLRTYQSGLILYWIRNSFYEMVKARRMHLKDYSIPIEPRALQLDDFKIPFRWFFYGTLVAIVLFVFELLRFYIKQFLDKL